VFRCRSQEADGLVFAGEVLTVFPEGRNEPVKVTIDYDLCEANALCTGLVPEVFEVDDEDNTNILVDEVPAHLHGQVRRAVLACPKQAISLQE
jgi:ferredoxin